MRSGLAALILLAVPSIATARPITVGVTAGLSHSQDAAESDLEPNRTLGLFGRIAFSSRIAAQVEAFRAKAPDQTGYEIRSGTALLVVDLGSHKGLVPLLLVGGGLDRAGNDWYHVEGRHLEGGFGLEYRSEGGLTIGANVRLGGQYVDATTQDVLALYAYPILPEGEYRRAQLTLGARF